MKDALRTIVNNNTAGSPTTPGLKWTHLTFTQIAARLAKKGISVCRKVVKRLLKDMGFAVRKLVKSQTKAPSRNRDAQFVHIAKCRSDASHQGYATLSVDTKKRQFLGPMYRPGTVIADREASVLDHALPSYSDGEVIPHGIYDVRRNAAHVNLNIGHDTNHFAVSSLKWYWSHIGRKHYPEQNRLLLLFDCGGSNSIHSREFKYRLWEWGRQADLTIEVAHYPVYCSKYNPIERRVFPHVEQALSGRTFADIDELAVATRQVETRGGLTTTAHVIDDTYKPRRETRRTLPTDCKASINHNPKLPAYNYTISPDSNRT